MTQTEDMSLQLQLQVVNTPAIVDGPIRLALTLKNTGPAPLEVPSPKGGSRFSYQIFSKDLEFLCTASKEELHNSRPQFGPRLPGPEPKDLLSTDATITYDDDLMSVLPHLLEPGQYLLEASLRVSDGITPISPKVPFEIVVSTPIALAQTLDVTRRRIVIVEFHEQPDGLVLIRKRESRVTLLDRFYDLLTFKPSARIDQVAIGVEAEYSAPEHWRWTAWLDGLLLHACVARHLDSRCLTGPIDLGLEAPALLPYGYLYEDGSGAFIVIGDAKGQRRMRIVTISPQSNVAPHFVDLRLSRLPEGIPHATLIRHESGTCELVLTWIAGSAMAGGVLQCRVDPHSGAVTSPLRMTFATTRPVVTSKVGAAILPGQTDALQLLLAPPTTGGKYTLATVTFDGKPGSTQDLASTEGLNLDPGQWILPSSWFNRARVLAAAQNEIWTEGRKIAEGNLLLSSMRLWAFDRDSAACTWFDATRGYRSRDI
jgi:hypothetical protein